MYHFIETPPLFADIESGPTAAIEPALAQSFPHWGFTAWTILGSLTSIILMYAHYHKGVPLRPRTILYPIFGDKIMKNSICGTIIDAFSVITVAAGTIGPIGFLGLQASYGLHELYGFPGGYMTQLFIIIGVVTVVAISAITGIYRGIQILSRFNVILTVILMLLILFIRPSFFIIDSFVASMGVYTQKYYSTIAFSSSLWSIVFTLNDSVCDNNRGFDVIYHFGCGHRRR